MVAAKVDAAGRGAFVSPGVTSQYAKGLSCCRAQTLSLSWKIHTCILPNWDEDRSASDLRLIRIAVSGFFFQQNPVTLGEQRIYKSDFSDLQPHSAFPSGWLSARLDSLPFDLCLEGIGLVGWERLGWCDDFTLFFSSSWWEALRCSTELCREKTTGLTWENTSAWQLEPPWATLRCLRTTAKATAELSLGKAAGCLPAVAPNTIWMQQILDWPPRNSLVWPLQTIWDGLCAVCYDLQYLSRWFSSSCITKSSGHGKTLTKN